MNANNEEDLLTIRRAMFGKQVDIFMSSDIGRYMLARAEDQKQEAFEAFKKCNTDDVQVVRALQNKIHLADSVLRWLGEAVSDGLQALNVIENRSDE